MNPIIFALRHPITVMVAMIGIVVGSGLAVSRMKIDIFPQLNLPVIYVVQPYSGMDPAQMEGLLTYYYEYHFLYISGIRHVESKNIQGMSMMKLIFHPGTDMAQAMAETIQYVNRARAFMPPGTVGPFVMRFDTGSVPVGYLVFSSETRSLKEIQDLALNQVRPMFASLPGVSAPPPFGGNARTIVVRVDPDRLRAYNLSPEEVVTALTSGNLISPSGNIRVQDRMPIVPDNAMVADPLELGKIPIRPGSNVYLRDLGVIADSTDIPTGYALVNGRERVYILVTKRAEASTLSVVNEIKANLPRMQNAINALTEGIKVSLEFDQSPYVTGAIGGVVTEGLLGALLTGLMVLLFLRDWRSVIVVVLNIPLALLGALIGLWLCDQSINLMTLGGLALAVGILVDEATVEVENIHTQMDKTGSIARAVRLGNAETAVPRLLAMLCILAVFLPSFFMQGAARALFVPLSLAVGFSMVTSYFLSSTFVPVLSVWLLRHYHAAAEKDQRRWSFTRLRDAYNGTLRVLVRLRWLLLPVYVALAGLVIWLAGGQLGQEIFPKVDAGQFQLRLRAPTGTRIERTEEIAQQALTIIKEKVGADKVAISLGYVGVIPSSYPINGVYQWMSGPEEAVLRVALQPGSGIRTEDLKEQLRKELPERLEEWLRPKWSAEGFTTDQVDERVRGLKLSFEPADIVNTVMSFGSPTPIEVVVSGPNFADNRAHAVLIKKELEKIKSLRDLHIAQPLDYPTVEVKIDRELAGRAGVTAEDVSRSLVAATSSSRFVVPNYWREPKTGIGYQVQVELPIERMNSPKEVGLVPIRHAALAPVSRGDNGNGGLVLLQDVAQIQEGVMPGEYDRYNMRRLVSMTANIQGEDLGRVAAQIARAVKAVNENLWTSQQDSEGKPSWKNGISGEVIVQDERPSSPPRGINVDVRGQVEPMQQMFGALAGGKLYEGLTAGLGLAVLAIFLLLAAYFQSFRLALASVSTAPAVVGGVALGLLITGTTLNIQSFMGAIMAVGVATANAILLVTFAERARREGASAAEAAQDGAKHRLRPILMTSFAMIAGMIPMALALGEGGQQVAPLARAVIGGLAAATLATLLVLPCAFAAVQGRSSTQSVSLDPDDAGSPYFEQTSEPRPLGRGPTTAH
jgi:multidrug efflux pump subunit AcrB